MRLQKGCGHGMGVSTCCRCDSADYGCAACCLPWLRCLPWLCCLPTLGCAQQQPRRLTADSACKAFQPLSTPKARHKRLYDLGCRAQEVQSDHLEFWATELAKAGYHHIYKKKTAELYTDNKYAIDGCATFYKRERFSLVKKYEVEFNKAALSLAESFQNQNQKKAALSRLLKVGIGHVGYEGQGLGHVE
eukprot:354857-Chlamydomonas_euryale.AAC.6